MVPGAGSKFGTPRSNLGLSGANLLYWRNYLWHCWDFSAPKWFGSPSCVRRKFSWGVHSVAYGDHLYLVCAICDVTIWRHVHVSKPTFWWATQYAYSYTRNLLILCVIALNQYKLSALQVRTSEENTLNATTQQFNSKNIRLSVRGKHTHHYMSVEFYWPGATLR